MQEEGKELTSSAAPPVTDPTSEQKQLIVLEPNATLYVSNIDWAIKKPILRRALFTLFSRHGKVLEVVTLRREGLRGQAWIIFEDIASATAALRAENGFNFFGKELKVAYAREKSDRIAKQDGTYNPKERRQKRDAAKKAKRMEGPSFETKPTVTTVPSQTIPDDQSSTKNADASSAQPPPPPPPSATTTANQKPPQTKTEKASVKSEESPPSNIIFAQNLPSECNEMMLAMLFRQYAGYKEVRIPRPGLAFVEFDDEPHATLAFRGLNGFRLTTTDTLNLKYGKTG